MDSSFLRDSPTLDEVGGASWGSIAHHVVWCIVTQIVLYGVCWVVNRFVWESVSEGSAKLLKKYVGIKEEPPTNQHVETLIRWVQFCCSLASVCFWVYKTYRFHVSMPVYILEFFVCMFYFFTLLLDLARYEFQPKHIWSFNAILDVWTVIPLLLQRGGGPGCGRLCPEACWVSFSYLRCLRVLQVWTEIEASGTLENVTEFARGVITTVIKFLVIVVLFSGTMFLFETLGDMGFTDLTMETEMGHTSFLALCYFTFVTISTVGYGDFSPMTVPGRVFVIVVILGGVAFFSIETGRMMSILKLSASGKGRFMPRNPRAKHVLVIGGGVNGPISVLESFLRSLVDPSHGDDIPEVVLMGPKGPEEDMVALLEQRWATRANIKYLWGNPAQRTDLHRARIQQVEMCYVLADVNAREAQDEDLQNIIRGAAVFRMFQTPLLVMMLEAKNVKVAVQTGIPERMCAALDDLEISTIASSAQCVGLSTIVINLALPDLQGPEEYGSGERWLEEYIDGANKELYGLQLIAKYHQQTFTQAAKDVYKSCGVMLIACQDASGSVVMNPGNKFVIQPSTVFFCIADDEDALVDIRLGEGRDWLEAYEETRGQVAARRLREQRQLASHHPRPALLALEGDKDDDDDHRAKRNTAQAPAKRPGKPPTPTKKNQQDALVLPGRIGAKAPGGAGGGKGAGGARARSMRGRQQEAAGEEEEPKLRLEELFEPEEQVEDAAALQAIVDEGNHVVVVGLTAGLFPQIVSIIKQLRHPTYPAALLSTPIIILYAENLHEHANIRRFLAGFPRLVYVRGSPVKLRSLITAGVDRCSRLLLVAGGSQDPKTSEPIMMDQEAILLLSVLESQRALWGRLPDVICELQVPSNIKQLDETYTDPDDPALDDAATVAGEGPRQEQSFSSQQSRTHARYAMGGIVLRAEFSSLFAAAYYTPGVLDLLKSMTQPPSSPAASIVWKVPCTPDMVDKTFSYVFAELVEKEAIPIGLCRAPRRELGNQLPWVYTCPDPDTCRIHEGDSVYLLASAEWVEHHKEYTRDLTGSYTPGRAGSKAQLVPERRCPQGHRLKALVTPQEGWGCDVCLASNVAMGTAMQGCKQCRWVCCLACYAPGLAPASEPLTNHFSSRPTRPPLAPASAPLPVKESPRGRQGSEEGSGARSEETRSRGEGGEGSQVYESDSVVWARDREGEPDGSAAGSEVSRASGQPRARNGSRAEGSKVADNVAGLMSDIGNFLDVRKLVPPPTK